MKEFAIYTGLRLLLFVAAVGVVLGVWALLSDSVNLLVALVAALVISGVGSYFLLNGPREALARTIDERARRATAKFDEMRAKEDAE
ncbi:DUF4229 domain-containing protein [Nocardioides acrostichi]|uniref:DUF4229 domain-containing protein n=1 Tax=Nocardioides acrostichi TaxID=2784339 RepID=A0A930UZQ1_9ACTN|nr:DUF4229 domain-containing protein [Nocardioides acrostichi]MBF4163878.1 DUF4229 domain-containing protein [Nocardioides acrostichi]